MRIDFQQCHPEGAKLQEGESFTSIKLSHYTDAFCDDGETELDNSFTHIGKKAHLDIDVLPQRVVDTAMT